MPTKYAEADSEVYDLMAEVLKEHFPALNELDPELAITILMATNYRGPAVKFAGGAATAKIKIVGPEERSNGGSDLRILVDRLKWAELTDRQKEALLHHELNHIVPQYLKGSIPPKLKLDPYMRPVVKLKPDDWVLTGFEATVAAFGADALEHRAVLAVHEQLRQMALPFVEASPAEREFAEKVADAAVAKPKVLRTKVPGVRRKAVILPDGPLPQG